MTSPVGSELGTKYDTSPRNTEYAQFTVIRRFPAYSADSSVKTPQTARKYREQAVYEAVVMAGI